MGNLDLCLGQFDRQDEAITLVLESIIAIWGDKTPIML